MNIANIGMGKAGHSLPLVDRSAAAVAKLMPGAVVAKTFNTIFAQHYASGLQINGQPLQTFVASDDTTARETVKALATDIGLIVRDVGPLKNARYLESLGFMNIKFGCALGEGTGIALQGLAA
ncbi:MAG: hypothetical protein ACOH2H_06525 [Cypionkella sp.]